MSRSEINKPPGDPDRPIPILRTPGKGRDPHYTPWLLLRCQPGDTGDRPLAPGTVFWESPDVWTEGSLGINQPVVNEPTKVFARITNLGLQDATGVIVKYWWTNPSIAITEQSAHLIGASTVNILSNNSVVFQCPADWVPVVENSGHECLFVEAFIPVFDPLTSPMQPSMDRHVGQKNENLVMLQLNQAFQFQLEAHNFTPEVQQVVIEARRGAIPRDFTRRFAGKRRWSAELLDPVRPLAVDIRLSREPSHTTAAAPAGNVLYEKDDCLGPAQAAETGVFKPGEIRRITVAGALPATAQRGEIHVIRITQRIGRVVTGGYTIYVTLDAHRKR